MTESNTGLLECFLDEKEDLEVSSRRWLKTFNNLLHRSFKKVRKNKGKTNPELDVLFESKEKLKVILAEAENNEDIVETMKINNDIEKVNEEISEICADSNRKVVEDFLQHASDGIDGFGHQKTWKMEKVVAPKNKMDPPTAKKDSDGNLITDLDNLEDLYLQTYTDRLQPNTIEPQLQNLEQLKEYLFQLRYLLAKMKRPQTGL